MSNFRFKEVCTFKLEEFLKKEIGEKCDISSVDYFSSSIRVGYSDNSSNTTRKYYDIPLSEIKDLFTSSELF